MNGNELHWTINIGEKSDLRVYSANWLMLKRHFGDWLPDAAPQVEEAGRVLCYRKTTGGPGNRTTALKSAPPASVLRAFEAAVANAKTSADWGKLQGMLFPNPQTHRNAYQVSEKGDGAMFILYGVAAKNYIPGDVSGDQVPVEKLLEMLRDMRDRTDRQAHLANVRRNVLFCVLAIVILAAHLLIYKKYAEAKQAYTPELELVEKRRNDFLANKKDHYSAARAAMESFEKTDFGLFFNPKRNAWAKLLGDELDVYEKEVSETERKLEDIRQTAQANKFNRAELDGRLEEYSKLMKRYSDTAFDSEALNRAAAQYDKLFQIEHVSENDPDTRGIYIESWLKNARETLGDIYYKSAKKSFLNDRVSTAEMRGQLLEKRMAETLEKIRGIPSLISSRTEMDREVARMRSIVKDAKFETIPESVMDAMHAKEAEFGAALTANLLETIQNYSPEILDHSDLEGKRRVLEGIVNTAAGAEPLPMEVQNALRIKMDKLASVLRINVQDRIKAFPIQVTNADDYVAQRKLLEDIAGPNPPNEIKMLTNAKHSELQNALISSLIERLARFRWASGKVQDRNDYDEKKKLLASLVAESNGVRVTEDVSLALLDADRHLSAALLDSIQNRLRAFPVGLSERDDFTEKEERLDALRAETPADADISHIMALYEGKKREMQSKFNDLCRDIVTKTLQEKLGPSNGYMMSWKMMNEVGLFFNELYGDERLTDRKIKGDLHSFIYYLDALQGAYFTIEVKKVWVESNWGKKKKKVALPPIRISFKTGGNRYIYKGDWRNPSSRLENINLETDSAFGDITLKTELYMRGRESVHLELNGREDENKILLSYPISEMTPAGLMDRPLAIENKGRALGADTQIHSLLIEFGQDSDLKEFYKIGLSYKDAIVLISPFRHKQLKKYSRSAEEKYRGNLVKMNGALLSK
jgi:hypothetical protein